MATQTRRPIGPAPAGAQAPATKPAPKAEDLPPADPVMEPAPADDTTDEIVPVDTESADYKAGYQNALDGVDCESNDYRQGYAAGLGSTGAAPADDAAPADAPAASKAGKPATVAELEALAPEDSAFVVAQLKAGSTLAQAQTASIRALQATVKRERDARLTAERKLEAESASPPPARLRRGSDAAAADPKSTDTPEATAKKEWAANKDGCRDDFADEGVYVAYRKREMARAGAR
jgi:hypothetical protein